MSRFTRSDRFADSVTIAMQASLSDAASSKAFLNSPAMTPYQLCHHIASLTRADRVLWFVCQSNAWCAIGSSVQTQIDPASPAVRRWDELLNQVAGGQTFDASLQRYRDEFSTQAMLLLPFCAANSDQATSYLVLETFAPSADSVQSADLRSDWASIDVDTIAAIQQTVDMAHRDAARTGEPSSAWIAHWPWIAVVLLALLAFIPVPLRLPVNGHLQPTSKQRCYAPAGARVIAIPVSEGQSVVVGDLLMQLRSDELDLQLETITGGLATAQAELAGRRTIKSDRTLNDPDGNYPMRSTTNELVLKERIASHEKQLELLHSVQESLAIRSRLDGQVRRWDTDEELRGRDVFQGQWLIDVVDVDGPMQAELEISDQHIGEVLRAQAEGFDLECRLRLRSQPGSACVGKIRHIASVVHPSEQNLPVVEMIASLEKPFRQTAASAPLVNATVSGDVEVGRRSLAYVLFRPLIETLREIW